MKVRIYKPSRSSTQSALGKTRKWILEYEPASKRKPEPLMGWSSADDTLNQVRLKFESAEDAVAYATKQGWEYSVAVTRDRRIRPRNYMDNFKFKPSEDGR
jgi:hypothetical protein